MFAAERDDEQKRTPGRGKGDAEGISGVMVGYAVASINTSCHVHVVNKPANKRGMGDSRAKPTTYAGPSYPICRMKGRSVGRIEEGRLRQEGLVDNTGSKYRVEKRPPHPRGHRETH